MDPQSETRPESPARFHRAPASAADCAIGPTGPTVIGAPDALIALPERRIQLGGDLATQIGALVSTSDLSPTLCLPGSTPSVSAAASEVLVVPVPDATESRRASCHRGFDDADEVATVCAFVEPPLPIGRVERRCTPRVEPERSIASSLPLVLPEAAEMTMIPQLAYRARPRPEPTEIERLPSPIPLGRPRARGFEEVTPQRYIATQITAKPATVVNLRSLTVLLSAREAPSLDLAPILACVLLALAVTFALLAL